MSHTKAYLDTMVQTYAETLLWTGVDWNDMDECDNPARLDAAWTLDEMATDGWQAIETDCAAFLELTFKVEGVSKVSAEQMGEDFALTRNRHGGGFWDRGLGILGDRLTELSHTFGESNLYVGDDEMLHVEA